MPAALRGTTWSREPSQEGAGASISNVSVGKVLIAQLCLTLLNPASWLSSHGRGLGPRDALKKDSRGLCRGAAGNPRVPRLLPGTLGNFPGAVRDRLAPATPEPQCHLWLSAPRVPTVSLHLPLQALVPFHNLGLLIGLFSPRCADLWPATRQEAVSCVHSLLYLQLACVGEPP